jgi:hypothetical protein
VGREKREAKEKFIKFVEVNWRKEKIPEKNVS